MNAINPDWNMSSGVGWKKIWKIVKRAGPNKSKQGGKFSKIVKGAC